MMTDRNKQFLDALDSIIAGYEQEGGVTIGMSLQIGNHSEELIDHYIWNGMFDFMGATDSYEDFEITKFKNSLTNDVSTTGSGDTSQR